MLLVLLASGLGLLALPGLARRPARRLAPSEWSRLCAAALAAGMAIVELAVLLSAAPTLLRALGVDTLASACERVLGPLAPGGPVVGWTALAAAIAMPVRALGALVAGRAAARLVHVEPWLGEHRGFGPHDLVVLPTDQPIAVSVAGPTSQIIVSRGLVATLSSDEVAGVLGHEAAHLDHGHQRFLLLAAAVEASLGVVMPVRRSTAALRVAIERWADEEAVRSIGGGREVLRSALLGVTSMLVETELAAFAPAGTVVERVEALSAAPACPSSLGHAVLYVPGVLLGVAGFVALGGWLGHARMLVAMAGNCPV